MKKRNWSSKEKTQIVLEGLKGQITISSLCQKYSITQSQYYQWRDRFLDTCHQAFESNDKDKLAMRYKQEISTLKGIIGDLTVELKKMEDE